VVGCVLFLPLLGWAQGVEAITKPSQEVKLAFVRAGLLGKLMVKEGQIVKEGDVLVQQDDSAEQAQLEQLRAEAADMTRVKAAQAQLAQKKVDLTREQEAHAKGAAPDLEVEHADLDVKIAGFQLDVEQFQRKQDALKAKALECEIERMRIKSPINGRVEEIMIHQGESGDALAKVLRIVNIDPLWTDVPMPLAQARKFQEALEQHREATVEVRFGAIPARGEAKPAPALTVKGKVIFLAAVAEAGSNTRMVRVEVPNPTARPAGEHVEVIVPSDTPAATAGNEKTEKVSSSSK